LDDACLTAIFAWEVLALLVSKELYANAHIIRHLGLTFAAERPPPSRIFAQVALMAAEESGEYK